MTIREKLESVTNGTPQDITIVHEEGWYVEVEYTLAGVLCHATLIRG